MPGISAGIGGLAYAGIPATHRDVNHSVIFLTGHDATGALPANVDWPAVATASPVIVMYMALKHLAEIASELVAGGQMLSAVCVAITGEAAATAADGRFAGSAPVAVVPGQNWQK